MQSAIPPAMTLEESHCNAETTSNDKELGQLNKRLTFESGTTKELHHFNNVRNELSVTRKGLIPVNLQEVWFHKMDEMVEKWIKLCRECRPANVRAITTVKNAR